MEGLGLGRECEIEQNPTGAFRCRFLRCQAKYRRKEHLHRHEAKHTQQQKLSCSKCGKEFGRSDTLRKHVLRLHKIIIPMNRAQLACERCHAKKLRCEGGSPCDECLRRRFQCSFEDPTLPTVEHRPRPLMQSTSSREHQASQPGQIERYGPWIDIYFEIFHPHWPFVHKGAFNTCREPSLLVQSMTVIGLWTSQKQSSQSAALEIHGKLGSAIREQKEKWDVSKIDKAHHDQCWPISTYQAILLHIIFSFIINSRGALDLDLKFSLPSSDKELLEALVQSCRRLGMLNYPKMLAQYKNSGVVSFVWVSVEEVKRFNLALYKVCGKLGKDNPNGDVNLAMPLLSISELQFSMPENEPLWSAITKDEWCSAMTEEELIDLDGGGRENWISKHAGLFQFLGI